MKIIIFHEMEKMIAIGIKYKRKQEMQFLEEM